MAKKRLRLCVLIPVHWEAFMGGSQYQAKLLIEKLVERDIFDIHYVARRVDDGHLPLGYTIHQIKDGRRLAGTYLQDSARLWRSLRRIEPDVIYQRVGCAHTGVAALYAKSFGKRLVWHVASDRNLVPAAWRWSLGTPLQYLEKRVLEFGIRNASDIVVQTREQDRILRANYGRPASAIIPNFHPEPAVACNKPAEPVTICWVANMKPLKRPDKFVQLAEDCRSLSNVEFVMIGAPSPEMTGWDILMERAERLGNLKYLGQQPQDVVNQTLAEAHLFVNTSDYEGFPNTFVQSWLHETPVLSLSVNPDNLFATRTIGICADGNYDRLRSELVSLVNDPQRRRRMGAAARAYARDHHSEGNISALIALLQASQKVIRSSEQPEHVLKKQ